MKPSKIFLFLIVPLLLLLSACTDQGCAPETGRDLADPDEPQPSCADTTSPHSMVIAYPSSNAIEQLSGDLSPIYSLKGAVIVTDQNGNAVPDGTVVQLDVFDTLISRGIIQGAGDSISSTQITDLLPLQGDRVTLATLNTSSVERNGDSSRKIIPGDLVLLRYANSLDQIRYVASVSPNTVSVTESYSRTYPNATYPNAEYLIGQSLIGTQVLGTDEDGNKTAGYTITKNGTGSFRLEYPGDSKHLNYGFVDYSILAAGIPDPRSQAAPLGAYAPDGSTEVWVVARTDQGLAVADSTHLPGIADTKISIYPNEATLTNVVGNQTVDITVGVLDAENVALPLVWIDAATSNSAAASVPLSEGCRTDETGSCDVTITWQGVALDTTITLRLGEETLTAKIITN